MKEKTRQAMLRRAALEKRSAIDDYALKTLLTYPTLDVDAIPRDGVLDGGAKSVMLMAPLMDQFDSQTARTGIHRHCEVIADWLKLPAPTENNKGYSAIVAFCQDYSRKHGLTH